uniref:C2H2-type domain-containing protein n=1 Tax=Romanomermis culicivorax TaxID=13658 RepID=A0A915IKX5_ROMCU
MCRIARIIQVSKREKNAPGKSSLYKISGKNEKPIIIGSSIPRLIITQSSRSSARTSASQVAEEHPVNEILQPEKLRFQCEHCTSSFSTKKGFHNHVTAKHENPKHVPAKEKLRELFGPKKDSEKTDVDYKTTVLLDASVVSTPAKSIEPGDTLPSNQSIVSSYSVAEQELPNEIVDDSDMKPYQTNVDPSTIAEALGKNENMVQMLPNSRAAVPTDCLPSLFMQVCEILDGTSKPLVTAALRGKAPDLNRSSTTSTVVESAPMGKDMSIRESPHQSKLVLVSPLSTFPQPDQFRAAWIIGDSQIRNLLYDPRMCVGTCLWGKGYSDLVSLTEENGKPESSWEVNENFTGNKLDG